MEAGFMEQKMYHVTIKGETKEYPEGIPYSEIVKEYEGAGTGSPAAVAFLKLVAK